MSVDENDELSNGELDRVIRAALVIDDDQRGVERLERFWRAQLWKDRWQRRGFLGMTAAAAALVLVGLLIVAKTRDERVKTANKNSEQVRTHEEVAVEEDPSPGPSLKGRGDFVGRAPTEYERFMFIARTGRPATVERENYQAELARIQQSNDVGGLMRVSMRRIEPKLQAAAMVRLLEIGSDEALVAYLSLVRNGSTRPSALAAAEAVSALPLAGMLASLDHEDKVVRRSAAIVLGHVNGPEVTRALIARVTEQPSGATEAWMALMECRGETAKEFIAYAASRPQLLGHLNNARVQLAYAIP